MSARRRQKPHPSTPPSPSLLRFVCDWAGRSGASVEEDDEDLTDEQREAKKVEARLEAKRQAQAIADATKEVRSDVGPSHDVNYFQGRGVRSLFYFCSARAEHAYPKHKEGGVRSGSGLKLYYDH